MPARMLEQDHQRLQLTLAVGCLGEPGTVHQISLARQDRHHTQSKSLIVGRWGRGPLRDQPIPVLEQDHTNVTDDGWFSEPPLLNN